MSYIDFNKMIEDFADSQIRVGRIIAKYEREKPIDVSYEPHADNITVWRCSRWDSIADCPNPNCSIFNHSNGGTGSNLPEGFREP